VHRRALFDADREHHETGRIRQLSAQSSKLAGIAVGDLVVDGDPAVAWCRHDRRAGAEDPRDEPGDGLDD
jgi:hypothetical protein